MGKEDLERDWESTFYDGGDIPGVEDSKHGRGTQHFDAGFAKYGQPGDTLQRRIELYLLDCGVTKEEVARFRSIMTESSPVSTSPRTSGASGLESIVFDTPASDEKGVMVLGNGEVGATAWLDASGTLHTVLQNSDSWNEGGRHVKTGAIDYETKAPVNAGTYRQELSMARGEFEASWKSGGKPVAVRYRIQHGTNPLP